MNSVNIVFIKLSADIKESENVAFRLFIRDANDHDKSSAGFMKPE